MISRVSIHSLWLIFNSIQGLSEGSNIIKVSQNALWLKVLYLSSSLGCLSITAVDRIWSKWDFGRLWPCCCHVVFHYLLHQSSVSIAIQIKQASSLFCLCVPIEDDFSPHGIDCCHGWTADVNLNIHDTASCSSKILIRFLLSHFRSLPSASSPVSW